MKEGIITKGVGGTYEVQTDSAVLSCTLRGRLRLRDDRVLVGDRVEVSLLPGDGGRGVVENILPRHSELVRPRIANVNQVAVVFAVENPPPNFLLLDRILVQAELLQLSSVVVINKGDLQPEVAQKLAQVYSSIPYPTVVTSVIADQGLDRFRELLRGKITTLAGPSGVGKSSLLNALDPSLSLETGMVSAKAQRGRHTTRSVQLISLGDGYVADTPGFSQLTLSADQEGELQYAFPEFLPHIEGCQFRGCLHRHEPGCAVKRAVEQAEVLPRRYQHYLTLLEEAKPRY
ncbi:MAG: ribosome small subunit-dependent GTPase A [Bacillota bacterium]|jgi:ribosome biogenesis GTPase|nr:ribosome small subunit-dependent GTPase A [Bacillota bacterium]HHT91086.1 ribosome small subunit-dependent GTPase A [Bacillota bacterium]